MLFPSNATPMPAAPSVHGGEVEMVASPFPGAAPAVKTWKRKTSAPRDNRASNLLAATLVMMRTPSNRGRARRMSAPERGRAQPVRPVQVLACASPPCSTAYAQTVCPPVGAHQRESYGQPLGHPP